jgi:hypothetical protein
VSGQTPVRLPLSDRQADALVKWLAYLFDRRQPLPSVEEFAALREVAGKLDTLREQ